jgi:hypothetical protein
MRRKIKEASPKWESVAQQPKRRWWNEMLSRTAVAVVLSTGSVLLLVYNAALTDFIKPTLVSGWEWAQDQLSPMSEDKLIGVNLMFYIPNNVNKERSFEAVSATFWPKRCKRPEGDSIVRTFDDGERDSYTNAIISISCRASGRTRITLTPESGTTLAIYDGIVKDGEKVPFPGVPGSYYAGLLTLYLLDIKMPDGPAVPVNKCQITNTCAEELFKIQKQH